MPTDSAPEPWTKREPGTRFANVSAVIVRVLRPATGLPSPMSERSNRVESVAGDGEVMP